MIDAINIVCNTGRINLCYEDLKAFTQLVVFVTIMYTTKRSATIHPNVPAQLDT